MSLVDIIIIGAVALPVAMGLRAGILMPASGIAGLALGIVLAVQYHGSLAFALTDQVDDELVRRVAASLTIVNIDYR